ncbi:nucleotidyltransferase domain-containing protein [Providencia vermicola]|uniref:Nucleotidyltransferase domain-containing protein n=1 Tax=Providencia stuartii TaxID=588 RepID=A0AAI9MWF0_PROST|nr:MULTISPECIES: nucleotidyltransferase domain-containing protein [Providencia]ELR5035050.1 nucleotidyltransferase domain-containing protein [Providencia stuartii]ELR5144148.1 nucleotidyltransferase domain-containing protein [Providencia stuartii]MBG5920713.1 nucleotidyltransferase domain-containing protein [Providencia stuartii]MTB39563.1 nucleotidyltransferase [Providencia sp. wls1949]MTC07862.1 nucleotidyltransferase [Providencia sp. wls1948]
MEHDSITPLMQDRIRQTLTQIEKTQRIKILYACESGSRGWGFASRDSDYDVRFIYVHQLDWYLTLDRKRDVIERPIDDELDVAGWELSKALKLMRNSNPALIEWLHSPIVYQKDALFMQQCEQLASKFYSPLKARYHYLSIAKRNWREDFKEETIRLKKYFYILRAVLALRWIEHSKMMPPMAFSQLVQATVTDHAVLAEIEQLLVMKQHADESRYGPHRPAIDRLITETIEKSEKLNLPEPYYRDSHLLDDFLQKTILANDIKWR